MTLNQFRTFCGTALVSYGSWIHKARAPEGENQYICKENLLVLQFSNYLQTLGVFLVRCLKIIGIFRKYGSLCSSECKIARLFNSLMHPQRFFCYLNVSAETFILVV